MNAPRRRGRTVAIGLLIGAAVLTAPPVPPARALRANLRADLDRLEQMGHYEEALFYRKSTQDMILAVHVAWSGAPYDPRMDGLYHEARTDRRYWNLVNGQKRRITALLAKAKLTAAQRELLDLRVRVYVEDHLSPDFDEMGNFYFRRKAWVMERAGLFYDASFRRRLTGYYCDRVCAPYYATMAEEFGRAGEQAHAAAYRAKASFWRSRAGREFRRSDGDRLLAQMQTGDRRRRLAAGEVAALLAKALKSAAPDARYAAVLNLADLGEPALLAAAVADPDAGVRAELARIAAESLSLPLLEAMCGAADRTVQDAARSILRVAPQDGGPFIRAVCALADGLSSPRTAAFAAGQLRRLQQALPVGGAADPAAWARTAAGGLKPGILAEYFDRPGQAQPVAAKVLPAVAIGLTGNERFPKQLRPLWQADGVIPAGAAGQFRVRFRGKLYVPQAGSYRFYVKTDLDNRATVLLGVPPRPAEAVISPRNDPQRLYALQNTWQGKVLSRVDFSRPVQLAKGFIDLEADYRGARASGPFGTTGLRLYWSGDGRPMESVPAAALFHQDR